MRQILVVLIVCFLNTEFGAVWAQDSEMTSRPPENVYQGELVRYPGPWSFQLGKTHIILVSDEELEALSDPDKKINLALTHDPVERSLREVCEEAQSRGARTLILAFDHFFSQYRPGQDKPRALTPDMDEYIQRIATISKFAEGYGLGLELSLLSPLEIGKGYRARTGESGVWMQYRKGVRDPKSGAYSVQLWQQRRWANNKGVIEPEAADVRVFAFKQNRLGGTPYIYVNPTSIIEISETAKTDTWDGLEEGIGRRIRVHGEGRTEIGPLDRVLVVQTYKTPEMDYFSNQALPFLKDLIDRYAAAGVKMNALYSDEMHIQQDWGYFNHHDNGEFTLRYVSPGLARRYADLYGAEYADFAKYLVYFTYGQEDTAHDLSAKAEMAHVVGPTPEAVRYTALLRSRYFRLLQDGVVDLFTAAKRHAEQKMGHRLEARAHATWAESPTIDSWNVGKQRLAPNQYEYTSNFVWSCTVHQAAAACYDYFKWGDFLTGNGNDHAEGGWLDRDYYALALGCSTGILNEVPYSYAAHWGMPNEISQRRTSLVNVYGAAGSPLFGMVEDMQHRDVEVLMLYPLDLVAAEERFGSWMTQYGYANYVTQSKLLERGKVVDGAIEMAGRRFTTLCTLFEPFPSKALLDLMRQLAETGGRVVWSGPPPVLTRENENALEPWRSLFGVTYVPEQSEGLIAPGRMVTFEGKLASVVPQTILTDLLVDRIHPVTPGEGTSCVARTQKHIIGTHRAVNGGSVTFLGYRPRDDQARSLGYEARNWFEILNTLGAYPPTGKFADVNDNTEYLSRTTPWLTCRFPNGTVAVAPHFRDTEEAWGGGFARKAEEDKKYIEQNPPPSEDLKLKGFKVNGHTVDYEGIGSMAFRVNESGDLIAFAGSWSNKVAIDGRETVFADAPVGQLAWAPVLADRRVEGGALVQAMVYGTTTIRIPAVGLPENVKVIAEGSKPGSRGVEIPTRLENGNLVIEVTSEASGRWLYVVPATS